MFKKKKMIHEKANFIELHTQKENISARQKKKKFVEIKTCTEIGGKEVNCSFSVL